MNLHLLLCKERVQREPKAKCVNGNVKMNKSITSCTCIMLIRDVFSTQQFLSLRQLFTGSKISEEFHCIRLSCAIMVFHWPRCERHI